MGWFTGPDTKLKRQVAIKVLPEAFDERPDALARFEREALAVAALSHPNILSIFDFGSDGDVTYAVMELLEGETLRDRLQAGPTLAEAGRRRGPADRAGPRCGAREGSSTGTSSPRTSSSRTTAACKILDFGLAKLHRLRDRGLRERSRSRRNTVPGDFAGDGRLHVAGAGAGDRRRPPIGHLLLSGSILYEFLSGTPALRRASLAETIAAILKEEPRGLSESGRIPSSLDRIVKHCLEKGREDRFQSGHRLRAFGDVPAPQANGPGEVWRLPPRSGGLRRRSAWRSCSGHRRAVVRKRGLSFGVPPAAAGQSIAVLPFVEHERRQGAGVLLGRHLGGAANLLAKIRSCR